MTNKSQDLKSIIRHAVDALDCIAITAREQHARGVMRGLDGSRGLRALSGAANRADELAGDLSGLIDGGYLFALRDWRWAKPALEKICRSRRTVIRAAEYDYDTLGKDDREGPQFDQLHEIEHRHGNYDAYSAVLTIADAIRFTLIKDRNPIGARVIAAEEMSALHAKLRECRL